MANATCKGGCYYRVMDVTDSHPHYSCDDEENEYEHHVQSMKSVLLSSPSPSPSLPTPPSQDDTSINAEPSTSPVEPNKSSKSAMTVSSYADSATHTLSMCMEENNFRCHPGTEPPVYSHRKLKCRFLVDNGTHRDVAITQEPDLAAGYPRDFGYNGSTFSEVILPGFCYLTSQPRVAVSSSSTRNTGWLAPKQYNLEVSSGLRRHMDIGGDAVHGPESRHSEVGLHQHMDIMQ